MTRPSGTTRFPGSGGLPAESPRLPAWLDREVVALSDADRILTAQYQRIAELRASGMQGILAEGDETPDLKSDYEKLLSLAMYSGEDVRHLIEVGKELARLKGWYRSGASSKSGGSSADTEKKFKAELARRKKSAS